MKLKRPDTSAIAAKNAFTSRLLYEHALQRMTAAHGRFDPTALASVVAASLEHEVGSSVAATTQRRLTPPVLRSTVPMRRRLKLVFPHPMADRRQAPIHPLSDLA